MVWWCMFLKLYFKSFQSLLWYSVFHLGHNTIFLNKLFLCSNLTPQPLYSNSAIHHICQLHISAAKMALHIRCDLELLLFCAWESQDSFFVWTLQLLAPVAHHISIDLRPLKTIWICLILKLYIAVLFWSPE
jgi:hypothetical protein